jgi:GNAT superfamily N-acetyltransferase
MGEVKRPQTTFKIREAQAGDAPKVAQLSGELGYPAEPGAMRRRLRSIARDPDHAAYAAEAKREGIVGWAHAFISRSLLVEPFVELGGLVVTPSQQRMGVGKLLMTAVEGWARRKGISTVRVRSRSNRKAAHAFYRKLGYQQLKTQETFFKEIRMTL